ncbi:hypothetical protein TEA_013137 [Camellia sinensis var. sinensis]|uniref:Protein kinase domain-containing protein n=1 Tax=Camellia sinensis var. sinensis TaxID=542762 RepID=A0A4S4EBW3_CAMSN|nr:hypothetical protein TEA_013137 [Camellia sinensis var. sinensis]
MDMCYCCCCCYCCTIYYYVTAAAIITFFLSSAPFSNAQPPPPASTLPSPPPLLPSPSPSHTFVKKNASATVVVGSPSPPLSSPSPPLPPSPAQSPSSAIVVAPAPSSPTDSSHRKPRQLIRIILGSNLRAFFGVFFMVSFCFYVFKNKGESKELDEFYVDQVPGLPIRFSYKDLRTMTCNFNDKLREGGFGSIFQEKLSDSTKIAVKHLNGFDHVKKSFLVEVETIGNIHHVNLVRLIGFCAEKSHRLLVYEYMSNGSLDTWIFHNHQDLTLGWQSRKKIIMVPGYSQGTNLSP